MGESMHAASVCRPCTFAPLSLVYCTFGKKQYNERLAPRDSALMHECNETHPLIRLQRRCSPIVVPDELCMSADAIFAPGNSPTNGLHQSS